MKASFSHELVSWCWGYTVCSVGVLHFQVFVIVKNLLSFDSQIGVFSMLTFTKTSEKHVCLIKTFFFFCTYIYTWLDSGKIYPGYLKKNKREILISYCTATVGSVIKLDLSVHFVNNQSLCVLSCGNPTSQAFTFSLWMSRNAFTYCDFLCTVYSLLRWTHLDCIHPPTPPGCCQVFKYMYKWMCCK